MEIHPVILSGGSGSRLWPLSTPQRPKQFLALTSDRTMLQLSMDRVAGRPGFADPMIVAHGSHADMVEAQLCDIASQARLILEPAARNTAPAIALAALAAGGGDAPLLIMPSDHAISEVEAFHRAIAAALPLVEQGWLVTFGIEATAPETGYGYISIGEALTGEVFRVDRFVEKPDLVRAKAMLASGNHAWNGGIFLFRADAYLAALDAYAPEILSAAKAAMDGAKQSGRRTFPDAQAFARSPATSIDYAVMEKAEKVAVVPVAMGWSDVGSWDALYEIAPQDGDGNAFSGDVTAIDTGNCFVHAEGKRVSMVGVSDLMVVVSGDDILILPRGRSQDIRRLGERSR